MRKYNKFNDTPLETFGGDSNVAPSFSAVEDMPSKSYGQLYDPSYSPHKANITIHVPATTTHYPLKESIKEYLKPYIASSNFLEDSVKFQSNDTQYLISNESANRMGWVLETKLNGSAVFLPGEIRHRRTDYMVPISDILKNVPQNYSVLQATIKEIANNITEGLTIDLMNRGSRISSSNTIGQGYRLKTHIDVRWGWLILPAVLTLASLVLVLITMSKSVNECVPFWKSSAIATLLHNVEWADQESRATPPQLAEVIGARVEGVHVELKNTEDGKRLTVCEGRQGGHEAS